ncbi:MAG: hypothetical protein P8075_01850 [Deltaproteobacteria bacterium]|jgi:hypothetical protein
MLVRKILFVFGLALFLGAGQAIIGFAGQGQPLRRSAMVTTETLHIMGKGLDYILVGEAPLYVAPEITKITSRNGTAISLNRLRTPCLAEVTYTRWMKGVAKLPVVLDLKVKSTKPGASSSESTE